MGNVLTEYEVKGKTVLPGRRSYQVQFGSSQCHYELTLLGFNKPVLPSFSQMHLWHFKNAKDFYTSPVTWNASDDVGWEIWDIHVKETFPTLMTFSALAQCFNCLVALLCSDIIVHPGSLSFWLIHWSTCHMIHSSELSKLRRFSSECSFTRNWQLILTKQNTKHRNTRDRY